MHRPGANPDAMTEADFLCDFCAQHHTPSRPMIEGHRGSLICGHCVGVAYTELVLTHSISDETETAPCTMCLETDPAQPKWRSPVHQEAIICKRCTKRTAGLLHSDNDIEWNKPVLS